MATERPDLDLPDGPPPSEETPGPSGPAAALPLAAIILLVCVIVGLVLFGGWVAFGFALALMLIGVLGLSRYVERIAWTRRSPARLREGLSGMNEDLAMTDAAEQGLSPHDVPRDTPTHHELVRRTAQARRRTHRRGRKGGSIR